MREERPFINIVGDYYMVHLAEEKLTLELPTIPGKELILTDMTHNAISDTYSFLYDTKAKEIYHITHGLKCLPSHVYLVEICGKRLLDPVFYYTQADVDDLLELAAAVDRGDRERYAVILPRVSLGGHEFFFDTTRMDLIDTLDQANRLDHEWFKYGLAPMLYNRDTRTRAGLSAGEDKASWISVDFPGPHERKRLLTEAHRYSKPVIDPNVSITVSYRPRSPLELRLGIGTDRLN